MAINNNQLNGIKTTGVHSNATWWLQKKKLGMDNEVTTYDEVMKVRTMR